MAQQASPSNVNVEPRRSGGCMRWVVIAVLAIVVIGAIAALASPRGSNTNTNTSSNTNSNTGSRPAAAATNTTAPAPATAPPAALAPSYQEIADKKAAMTDAQWDEYAKTLKGLRIEGWQGTILNVDDKVLSDMYQISVDLDGKGGSFNVAEAQLEVTKEAAMPLAKGQAITFSGLIKAVNCLATYCPVDVEQVTFSVK